MKAGPIPLEPRISHYHHECGEMCARHSAYCDNAEKPWVNVITFENVTFDDFADSTFGMASVDHAVSKPIQPDRMISIDSSLESGLRSENPHF